MAVTFNTISSVSSSSGTSPASATAVTTGITLTAGRLLIADLQIDTHTATGSWTVTPPSGWTLWPGMPNTRQDTTDTVSNYVYYIADTGSAPALTWTLAFTGNPSVFWNIRLWQFSGANNSSPSDVTPSKTNGGSVTTLASIAVTPTQTGDALLVLFGSTSQNIASVTPAGLTQQYNDPASNEGAWGGYQLNPTSGSATTAYAANFTVATREALATQILIAPPAAGNLPLPAQHSRQRHRVQRPRPRRRVRSSIELRLPGGAFYPLLIRHRGQRKRLPPVRPKRRIRGGIGLSIPQAPAAHVPPPPQAYWTLLLLSPPPLIANLPLTVQHRGQRKRNPRVRAKRQLFNRWLIEQAPASGRPYLPVTSRRRPRPLPRVRPKRDVRSSINPLLSPKSILSPALRHPRGQPKRIPRVKAKRVTRSSIELRIPPAPPANLPLSVRRGRSQPTRIVHVKAKRHTLSSLQLRIPQAPPLTPPLPIASGRRARHKRSPLSRPRHRRSLVTLHLLAPSSGGSSFAVPPGVPNSLVVASGAAGTFTVLLPPATGSGNLVVVVRSNLAGGNVLVGFQQPTDTINGVNAGDTLTTQWQVIRYADYTLGGWVKV